VAVENVNAGNRQCYPINKPKIFRCVKYLRFIRGKPCMTCGALPPSDPHHVSIKGLTVKGTGIKVSDLYTVPLCRICHSRIHQGEPHGHILEDKIELYITIIRLNHEWIESVS
jgi:hypothetical protein